MLANGYITKQQHDDAKAEALNVTPRDPGTQLYSAEYFTEEVRRQLSTIYGEDQLYGGGLSRCAPRSSPRCRTTPARR